MKYSHCILSMIIILLGIIKAFSSEISDLETTSQAQSLTISLPKFCKKTSIRNDDVHVNYDLYLPISDDVNLIGEFNLIDFTNQNFQPLISIIPEEYREGEKIYSFNNVRLKKIQSSSTFGVPLVFTLGEGIAIKGFEQGLYNMCIGEQRMLVIPPELAYGASGAPGIPANSTVVFHVELVKINRKIPEQFRLD